MAQAENIALFDLDDTLCDYIGQLSRDLERLRAPCEPRFSIADLHGPHAPAYLKERAALVKAPSSWWANLPRYRLGWDVLAAAQSLDFKIVILTQTPRLNPAAAAGKQEWVLRELDPDVDIELTRNKRLVYGKVLVDDYPPYADAWLAHRKNGLVIMPANEFNRGYTHPNAIRYDGSNLDRVRRALDVARARAPGQSLVLDA